MVNLPDLLKTLVEKGGSDLHITTNSEPQVRLHGHLERLPGLPLLTPSETKQLAYSVLTDSQKKRFEETLELFIIGLRIRSQRRCHLANIIAYLEQRFRILIKALSIIVPVFCWFELVVCRVVDQNPRLYLIFWRHPRFLVNGGHV